jgi:hypothetical protein
MGQIAMVDRIEYEYEYRDAEYEYEKKHEQSTGPRCSIDSFLRVKTLLIALGQWDSFVPRIGFRRTRTRTRTQRSGTQ